MVNSDDPPLGVLMSMALRYDHAIACPGYYDQPIFGKNHTHEVIKTVERMRDLYQRFTAAFTPEESVLIAEICGGGFWSAEKNKGYEEMYRELTKQPSNSNQVSLPL
jgi:hypothetical protein